MRHQGGRLPYENGGRGRAELRGVNVGRWTVDAGAAVETVSVTRAPAIAMSSLSPNASGAVLGTATGSATDGAVHDVVASEERREGRRQRQGRRRGRPSAGTAACHAVAAARDNFLTKGGIIIYVRAWARRAVSEGRLVLGLAQYACMGRGGVACMCIHV